MTTTKIELPPEIDPIRKRAIELIQLFQNMTTEEKVAALVPLMNAADKNPRCECCNWRKL